MSMKFSVFCIIYFLLVEVIFASFGKNEGLLSYNGTTNYTSSEELGRFERSIFDNIPLVLKITIRYPSGEEVDLQWIKKEPLLANEYLPVITPLADLNPNIMRDVGSFVLFHDESQCSAVVYFEKMNAFYGVVGIHHYVHNLPYNFNETGHYQEEVIGEPYIGKQDDSFQYIQSNPFEMIPPNTSIWENRAGPSTSHERNVKRLFDGGNQQSVKRQKVGHNSSRGVHTSQLSRRKDESCNLNRRPYYLEILIFVTRDTAEFFLQNFGRNNYIECLVKYYIVYFNTVNMYFQSLNKNRIGEVHLNIGKIIIEDEILPFDILTDGKLEFLDATIKLTEYLHLRWRSFTVDSFDHIFVSTSQTIWNMNNPVKGISRNEMDFYESRKNLIFYEVVPITIVEFKFNSNNYIIATQEIAQVLGMEFESIENESALGGNYNYIMQRGSPRYNDCLKWSNKNREQFKIFLKQNRNRCCLLNPPRSLQPNQPRKLVTPQIQCICYGYDSFLVRSDHRAKYAINNDNCARPLQCVNFHNNQTCFENTAIPFDGTPCGTGKVCWEGVCVYLPKN